MKYYIHDTTIGKYVYFNQINELVSYFDQLIPRAFKMNKSQYIQYLEELGHNANDSGGVTLCRVLSEQFNIGIVRKDGKYERTDIQSVDKFQKEEYGD